MIRIENLKEVENFPGRVRFKLDDAASGTLDAVSEALSQSLDEYGIPYTLQFDEVESGGLFSKQRERCLCIINPQHVADYFKYCIRMSVTGNVAFATINYYGQSALTGKKNLEEDRKKSGSLGRMALGAIFKTDNSAFEAEYQYYDVVDEAIKDTFGI
ncbi:MAG: hypothetical protein IKI49_00780 [Oscillospiraceae bacterium]|nr:hypothetical protein [Oscillospiraceae bacterium]